MSALASLFRMTISVQLTRCMCKLSHKNWSWCHQSIVCWCPSDVKDFGWWYLYQYWKGIKGECMRGQGVPVPVPVKSISKFKLAFSEVLWCIPAPGQSGISTFKWNHVFGYLFICGHMFLNWPSLHFHQPACFRASWISVHCYTSLSTW